MLRTVLLHQETWDDCRNPGTVLNLFLDRFSKEGTKCRFFYEIQKKHLLCDQHERIFLP